MLRAFGETLHRDLSTAQIRPQELDIQWAKVSYVPGRSHKWRQVTDLGSFHEVVRGLTKVAAYLPSFVLQKAELSALYDMLADIAVGSGHHADVPMLFVLFKRRLAAHCTALVHVTTGSSPNLPIPPLITFSPMLQAELDGHRGFAFNRCMAAMSGRNGVFTFPQHDGTSPPGVGKRPRDPHGPQPPHGPPQNQNPGAGRVPLEWRGICVRCHQRGHQLMRCPGTPRWNDPPAHSPQAYKDFCRRMREQAAVFVPRPPNGKPESWGRDTR